MSFDGDKKREHAALADKAVMDGDYGKAAFHLGKTAEFVLKLADKTDGNVRQRFIAEAAELVELGEQLQSKAAKQTPSPKHSSIKEATGEEDAAQSQWQVTEKPAERLDDVAGLDAVKQELRDKVIEPFLHPTEYAEFDVAVGGGILMYGPPGNGKTFIAMAIAGELDAAFFNIDGSDMKNKYVGETEKNIKKLFDEARKHDRAIIFIDEADQLLSKKGNQKIGAVTQFQIEMQGLERNKNCLLVIGATNVPWDIGIALLRPGRFGTLIYVGLPDSKARNAMLAFNLRKKEVPVAADLDFDDIVAQTQGYSGADLAELCDRAKRSALKRKLAGKSDAVVNTEDFENAISIVRPSVTTAMLKQFEVWRNRRSGPNDAGDDDE